MRFAPLIGPELHELLKEDPDQIRELCRRAGLEPTTEMVWWDASTRPSADAPRYQVICERLA